VQFDYEKAVSNYLGTQSTFNPNSSKRGGLGLVRVNPAGGLTRSKCTLRTDNPRDDARSVT